MELDQTPRRRRDRLISAQAATASTTSRWGAWFRTRAPAATRCPTFTARDGVPWISTQSAHRDDAGSQWEGRDAKDNLQTGSLVPDAGAGRGIGFEGAYGKEWEGRDSLDNLQIGSMVPDEGASRREGYEGVYSDAHAGEDTRSNIVRAKGGFTTTEEAAQREAFAAAYGEAHEGWDARESG